MDVRTIIVSDHLGNRSLLNAPNSIFSSKMIFPVIQVEIGTVATLLKLSCLVPLSNLIGEGVFDAYRTLHNGAKGPSTKSFARSSV